MYPADSLLPDLRYALAQLDQRQTDLLNTIETDGAHPDPDDQDELERVENACNAISRVIDAIAGGWTFAPPPAPARKGGNR